MTQSLTTLSTATARKNVYEQDQHWMRAVFLYRGAYVTPPEGYIPEHRNIWHLEIQQVSEITM